MTDVLAGGLVGAVVAGSGGLLVRPLVARLPAPYREVADDPGLTVRAVAWAAGAGALVAGAVGLAWPLLYLLPVVPVAVAVALLDQRLHVIPTVVVWPTLGGVALLATGSALLSGDPWALARAVAGSMLVGGIFYALWRLRSAGMGFGDVRLSTVVGFALGYLGWGELVVGVYAGFVAFSAVALARAAASRDRALLRTAAPYGPYLLGGALAGVVLGDPVWAYLVSG